MTQGRGYHYVPNCVYDDRRLTCAELAVLLYLYYRAPRSGRVVASYSEIAQATRLAPRTVVKAIRQLEQCQWITRHSYGGAPRCNVYELSIVVEPEAIDGNPSR